MTSDYEGLPFEVTEKHLDYQIRKFSSKSKEDEIDWHRDREDREVTVLSGSGWMIQVDNELPITLGSLPVHCIPKDVWHRVIRTKNATDLTVRIRMPVYSS